MPRRAQPSRGPRSWPLADGSRGPRNPAQPVETRPIFVTAFNDAVGLKEHTRRRPDAMRSLPLFLAFVAPAMACASEPSFYSFASRAFVPLEQVPARKNLVGTWRRDDERDLVLRPDGKFSMGSSSGCWDVDRNRLLLRHACVNYGATNNSAILAIGESTDECAFTLTANHLQIRNCNYAGSYRR